MPKRGFTLIELLITISIIAILSAIGLITFNIFIKNARDAKRQSDLKTIQSALEQYHADQKYYPLNSQVTPGSPLSAGGRTYLAKVPNDPKGSPVYSYIASPTGPPACDNLTQTTYCTSYCLYAGIEGTVPPDSACTPAGEYNYGVTKP